MLRLSLSGQSWAMIGSKLGQTGLEVDEYFGSSGIGGEAHSQPGMDGIGKDETNLSKFQKNNENDEMN